MTKLSEFIHSELQQGKTIAEIKRDVKTSGRGWTNKEVSKAIHAAVKQELQNRKPAKQGAESYNANKMWLWAIASAVIAVVVLAALFLYLFRE